MWRVRILQAYDDVPARGWDVVVFWETSCGDLDESSGRFDGERDDIAGLIYCGFDLIAGAFDRFLGFITEALRLIFEVIASVFEVITSVLDTFAKLPTRLDTGLRSVKKGN